MIKDRSFLALISRWLIAISLLTFIIYKIDAATVWKYLITFDPYYGGLMITINIALIYCMALRWKLIAEKLSIKAGFFLYLRAIWLGTLSGQIGPPLLFSEITRFKVLENHAEKTQLIGSQIIDRLSGQIVLLLLIILLLPINFPLMADSFPKHLIFQITIYILVVTAVITGFNRYYSKRNFLLQKKIIHLLNPIQSLNHFTISLVIQLLLILCFMTAIAGLDRLQQPLLILSLLPLFFISLMLLPISISDWGTREAVAVFFLSFSGLTVEEIVVASLIFGVAYSLTALLGLFFLFAK